MSYDLRTRQPDGSYANTPRPIKRREVPRPGSTRVPFSMDDIEALERINDKLCDGYAGEAAVALGLLLDDIERRAKLSDAGSTGS